MWRQRKSGGGGDDDGTGNGNGNGNGNSSGDGDGVNESDDDGDDEDGGRGMSSLEGWRYANPPPRWEEAVQRIFRQPARRKDSGNGGDSIYGKQGTAETWLRDATTNGAHIAVNASVQKILTEFPPGKSKITS